MKLTIFTLLSIASTLVSASGGLALRAGNCPAAASKICGSGAGGLKDCCPQGTMCTVVGRKTYCCFPGDEMCSQGRITTCAVPSWGTNSTGYCTSPSSPPSTGSTITNTTAAPTSTRTGYTTITALPTTTGIVTDSAPIPNITMTGAAAGPPDFHRGVSVGGWLGALVLGYLAL